MKNNTTKLPRAVVRGFNPQFRKGSGPLVAIADALNLSQTELAAAIGMSLGAVRKHERAGTVPKNAAIRASVARLGASVGVEIEAGQGE